MGRKGRDKIKVFRSLVLDIDDLTSLGKDLKAYVDLYKKLGFSIIPLQARSKSPALETWKEYQSRKPSDQELAQWFNDTDLAKGMNIGIVCGPVSGNLVVIDFDDPEIYYKFFDAEKIEKDTLVIKTSRGIQVYLLEPFTEKPTKSAKIPELKMEIRSSGNYVVAPPSIHPSGAQYVFLNPKVKNIKEVEGLEESLWKRIEELGVRKRVFIDPTWRTGRVGTYKGSHPPCIEGLLQGVTKGSRHEAAIRLFSYFINFRGGKPKQVAEKLKKWNKEQNKPPLEEAELEQILASVAKGPYNYGCTDSVFRCWCKHEECEIGKNKISAEAMATAEELVSNPEKFLGFLQQCLEYRLTGELKNRIFMFLAGCGASIKTILVRLCGPNSVGKNMLCSWMQEVFGSDRVIVFSSATSAWLKRKVLQGMDTRGKIFILLEERGEKQGALKYQFEQIYSEDKIVLGLNVRNEESGEWEPTEVVLQGPLCFITTSTELEFSLHAQTREWEIYPDESIEQTERISRWQDWRELLPLEALEEERKDLEVLKAYIGLLKVHKDYRIPFVNKINFKSKEVADRRRKADFISLMKYASHLFQGSLPVDPRVDIVFAMPFIYDFVTTIADDIIYTARGGLTKSENKVIQFVEHHPEIYIVTSEGKIPRKQIKTDGYKETVIAEPVEGFIKRSIFDHSDFASSSEGMNEKTLRNALMGLVRKQRLTLLKETRQGSANVYGKILSNKLESSKKALLPEITAFSTDFLTWQLGKILYGKTAEEPDKLKSSRSLIENCQLSKFKITSEMTVFQPKWHHSELFELLERNHQAKGGS